MTKSKAAQELGSLGGKARASRLSADKKTEIARNAANTRWSKYMTVRNYRTNELAPAHKIGTDEEGRRIYQFVEGWEPTFPYESDEDGNWIALG